MKKLPKCCTDAIANAESELQDAIQKAQDHYDDHSDKWKETEKGEDYSAWLDHLQEALDILQGLEPAPGGEA